MSDDSTTDPCRYEIGSEPSLSRATNFLTQVDEMVAAVVCGDDADGGHDSAFLP